MTFSPSRLNIASRPHHFTRRIASACVLTLAASSCDEYTCLDLANCASPELDSGASPLDAASPSGTTDGSVTSEGETTSPPTPTDTDAVVTTPASSSSGAEEESTGDGQSTTTESVGASDVTTTGDDEHTGCTDPVEGCWCEDPSIELDCWETPDGTQISDDPADAIGDCRLGSRSCVDGKWTACLGAVAPKSADSCDRPLADDDCNGKANEGCDCTPTDTRACGTDEALCVAGTQTCGEDGQWEDECVGEVPPAEAESCATVSDANCDGEKNEGCECIGTEVEPCNDCGERSCNPNTGRWGACEPVEGPRCSADNSAVEVCSADGNWDVDTCMTGDAAHCAAACSDSDSAPSCVITARDEDEDGQGSIACEEAPGSDCDDSNEAVYSDATELCDGVDNDCDGKVDLSDGLSVVGTTKDIADRSRVAVAASPSGGYFVLIGTSPSEQGLFFGSINASGTSSFSTDPMPISSPSDEVHTSVRAAWGSDLGVFYTRVGHGGSFAFAGISETNGCCWEDIDTPGNDSNFYPRLGDITARDEGDLLMVGGSTGTSTLYLATYESGVTSTANSMATPTALGTYAPRLASSGNNSGLIWQTDSPRSLNWSLISSDLEFGTVEELSSTAFYADVSAISAGFGLAWVEGLGFRFAIKKANGSTQCTSNVIPFGTVAANQELAIADSANGVVVVVTSPDSNLVRLYRFDGECEVIDSAELKTGASAPKAPAVARSGANLVIYWTEGSTGHYRFVSDQLCH